MPPPRGVKRTASKSSAASTASAAPKTKKKKNVVQLEVPTLPTRRGRVLTCGQGDVGQLGLGEDVVETARFKHVTGVGEKIVDTCAGGMHTIALDTDGKVWTFGCNDEGALGRPTSGDSDEGKPSKVALPLPAVAISAGDSHSAALLNNGDVYAWGSFRDSHGSMGLIVRGREGKSSREPIRVDIPEPAAGIASGSDHLVILTTGGAVYTLGCGEQGQLGRLAQRSASRDNRYGFTTLLTPGKVTLKAGASRVWAGYHATFVLDASADRMHAFGLNNYSQLGITGEKRKTAIYSPIECDAFTACGVSWKAVAAGQHHSLALDTNGTVYAVGRVEYGRLGLGSRAGDAEGLEPIPKLHNKKVVSIAAGTSNSFAVTDSGEIFAWGMGSEGQLGTGGSSDANEPTPAVSNALNDRKPIHVSAGGQHTVLLVEDPNAVREKSLSPEKETEEQKMEDVEEEQEPEPKKKAAPAPKGRGTKRQRKQEQEEEVSSTSSSAQRSDVTTGSAPAPQKVNGDEEKETPMEVDETDNKKEETKGETKKEETKPEMDMSSQDSADSETKAKPDIQTDVEMKDAHEKKTENAETKPEPAATKPEIAETKPKTAETKPKTAETKPETAETKPETAKTKPETAKTKPLTAETKPKTAETKPETAETKPKTAETKQKTSETEPETAETKSETTETNAEVNGAPEETKIEAKTVDSLQTDQVLTSTA